MSRVILHIGTHKTATTALQDGFAAERSALAEAGLIYPRLGPPDYPHTGHHGLVEDWNPLLAPYALPGGGRAALREIAATYQGSDAVVLLSSEEFSRGRDGGRVDFRALRADLAGFERIEVLCTLREPWQFLQSVWIEVARSKQPPKPRDVVAKAREGGLVAGLWADYTRLYAHLREAFAADEITFLDYHRAAQMPGRVPGAVLSHLGIDFDRARLKGMRANISPPPIAMWAASYIAVPQAANAELIEAATSAFYVQCGPRRANTLWSRKDLAALQKFGHELEARLSERLVADGQKPFALTHTAQAEDAVHPEDLSPGFWRRMARRQVAVHRRAAAKAQAEAEAQSAAAAAREAAPPSAEAGPEGA